MIDPSSNNTFLAIPTKVQDGLVEAKDDRCYSHSTSNSSEEKGRVLQRWVEGLAAERYTAYLYDNGKVSIEK